MESLFEPSRARVAGICASISIVLLVGALGCKRSYGPDVVATVNGQPILGSEVEKFYRTNLGNNKEQPTKEQAEATRLGILKQLIDDEMVQQAAKKMNLVASDEEVDAKLAEMKAPYTQEEFDKHLKDADLTLSDLRVQIRRSLTTEKLLNKEVNSRINITDADVSNFYNANKAQFNFIEPKYDLADIVVTSQPTKMQQGSNLQNSKAGSDAEARRKIEMIHNRLESGEDFATLAQNLSENPNDANNGGNMGFVPESSLRNQPPPIFAAISRLQPGQITDVIPILQPGAKSPVGYAIYKLIEKEPAGQRELNDPRVQQDIRQQLRDSRSQLLRAAYYEILRDQTKVENHLAEQIFKDGAQ
ncbi:MAG TPA: SurA N-terminal domain-containing protein [Acidobacteriaceae bacterium]|nr:SurA N-terminal domain-containing protein [Acidobacteriaceae bacterium]